MNVAFYIAKKYVNSRNSSSAINIITGITAVGILMGAMVMFVVLSAFSGLREYSLSLINGSDPDLKLTSIVGKTIDFTKEEQQKLDEIEGIAHYSAFLEERVLLRYKSKEQIAYIKGVDQNFGAVNAMDDFIYMGEWLPEDNQAVIDYNTAYRLSIGIFDFENTLEIMVPKAGKGSFSHEDFNKVKVRPIGVYSFDNDDQATNYVFVGLPMAQQLLDLSPNKISGIEFKLKPKASESKVKSAIQAAFGSDVLVQNRTELNQTLHKMLNTENLIVYLIITLVIIITLFTLIGTIIMVILDKRKHLKTLFNLGMPIKDLRKVFLYQGILLSFLGCMIGLLLGIAIVLLQQEFSLWMLSQTLAYPVSFSFLNLFIVFATIMALSFLASKIASDRVSEKLF